MSEDTTIVTVLTIEGDVYYSACANCPNKVELIPDTNKGWCKKCNGCISNPQPKYRLTLRVSKNSVPLQNAITIFGNSANDLFGTTAKQFFKRKLELNMSDDQLKQATHKSLLGEVLEIQNYSEGVVSHARFTAPTASTIQQVLQEMALSETETRSPPGSLDSLLERGAVQKQRYNKILEMEYKRFFSSPDSPESSPPLRNPIRTKPIPPGERAAARVCASSTPRLAELRSRSFMPSQDTPLSPIVPQQVPPTTLQFDNSFGSLPDSPMQFKESHPTTKSNRFGTEINAKPERKRSGSFSKLNKKRRKRRRAMVQDIVLNPPTQHSLSEICLPAAPICLPRDMAPNTDDSSHKKGRNNTSLLTDDLSKMSFGNFSGLSFEEAVLKECQKSGGKPEVDLGKKSRLEVDPGQSSTSTESLLSDPGKKSRLEVEPDQSSTTESLLSELDSKEARALDLLVAGKQLEDEIQDIDSVDQSPTQTIDTFPTQAPLYLPPDVIAELMRSDDSMFEEESKEAEVSIPETQCFEQLCTVAREPAILSPRSSGTIANSSNTRKSSASPSISNTPHDDTGDSSEDLFAQDEPHHLECSPTQDLFSPVDHENKVNTWSDGARARKPSREPLDWSKLSQMSSQEISRHFDFKLSESEEEILGSSDDCSAELF